jgi:hypothetical protein
MSARGGNGHPGPGLDDRAAALALAWAGLYTRRLPDRDAERRTDELASDLWEQRALGRAVGAPGALVAVSILRRTVAGVPADLSWRQSRRAAGAGAGRRPSPLTGGGRPMLASLRRNWWLVLAAVHALLEIALGIAIGVALEPDRSVNPGSVAGGIAIAAGGVLVLAGIAVRRRRRFAGDVMIAAGALPAMPFFWLILPLVTGLVVVAAAAVDAAEARSLQGGPASSRSGWALAATGIAIAISFAAIVYGAFPIALAAAVVVALALFAGARRSCRPA